MSTQRILLTGANGYVGSHILAQLLSRGHSIRAVIRSNSKAAQMAKDFPSIPSSKLDYVVVPDITAPGAFTQAVQSTPPFDTVIHTASPFLYRVVNDNREFLDPAIKGTTEMLRAVRVHAPGVKRVVVTSSCAAVVNFGDLEDIPPTQGKVYTESDWNPIEVQQALDGNAGMAYRASKKFAEKAAWDFIEKETPRFDLVTLMPPMVYGPIRHSVQSVKDLNESTARIYSLFLTTSRDAPLPPNGMHVYTDVRDLAFAHAQAATLPEAGNNRFIICAGQVTSQNISDVLRENPELQDRVPLGTPGGNPLPADAYQVSSEKAQNVLGVVFRSQEETFGDMARQFLEMEKREKADEL